MLVFFFFMFRSFFHNFSSCSRSVWFFFTNVHMFHLIFCTFSQNLCVHFVNMLHSFLFKLCKKDFPRILGFDGMEHLLGKTDGHLVVARILGESASELTEGVGGIETQPSLVAVDLVGLACLLHALSARQGDGSGSLRTYHGILGEGCERREGQEKTVLFIW